MKRLLPAIIIAWSVVGTTYTGEKIKKIKKLQQMTSRPSVPYISNTSLHTLPGAKSVDPSPERSVAHSDGTPPDVSEALSNVSQGQDQGEVIVAVRQMLDKGLRGRPDRVTQTNDSGEPDLRSPSPSKNAAQAESAEEVSPLQATAQWVNDQDDTRGELPGGIADSTAFTRSFESTARYNEHSRSRSSVTIASNNYAPAESRLDCFVRLFCSCSTACSSRAVSQYR